MKSEGLIKSLLPDHYTDEEWTDLVEAQRHEANMGCMHQVDALLKADWKFVVDDRDLELWQWQWRRPPRRRGSKGRLFLSTNQAYNALQREIQHRNRGAGPAGDLSR